MVNDIDITPIGAHEDSGSKPSRVLDDPDLLAEWSALEDPEDRGDYLDALQTLAEMDEEELSSWEDVKAELGY